MILRELVNYYDRSDEVAPPGWERKRIPYLIEIEEDGTFVQLTPLRSGARQSETPAQLVPSSENRQGTKAFLKPNLLWDHIGFVLGHAKSSAEKDIGNAEKQVKHFRKRIDALAIALPDSAAARAVQRFYEHDQHLRVRQDARWSECSAIAGCNVTFRLAGHTELLVHDEAIRSMIGQSPAGDTSAKSLCLVTGEVDDIERLHPPIAGVGVKPAPLAAINDQSLPALASFGKHQGENFPVGKQAAFKYATALNHLLRPGSSQKLRVGSDIAVFWAKQKDAIEDEFSAIFGNGSNPDEHAIQLRRLYESIHRGDFDGARGKNVFFVLGLAALSPGRLAVRFWHAMPLNVLARQIAHWFSDLEIVGAHHHTDRPGLQVLLSQVCMATKEWPHGDIGKLPPAVIAQTYRAAFSGSELPALLLQSALTRIRSDQAKKDDAGKSVWHVSPLRAAILKASVNRQRRHRSNDEKEITVALDKSNTEPAYLWGRMFAAYERTQELASDRTLNRTIRDAYFGSAMATPRIVYNRLVKLNQVHLRELKRSRPGSGVHFDRLLTEIAGKLPANPATAFAAQATPLQQASFAIGYYHQRQDLFPKPEVPATVVPNAPANAPA